ncbi:helix-hairpin-helix domain-containing protein [Allocoleopsis sp.]|uniref:helix-hairpin-helix domain-containing protein n=1 Tax=Allocoleopsis sp. TaxID=3088169 RepID=UPI002FCFE740
MKDRTLRSDKGEIIELESHIASSGEGEVWRVKDSDLVAKIYRKNPSIEQIEKLSIMMNNPPKNPNADKSHTPWAWPESFILHRKSKVGFLMKRIKGGRQIIEVYNPLKRRAEKVDANWQFLHAVALNFATIVRELHSSGYVIGDIKPQNILTNSKGWVSIVDIDSIQVKHPSNPQKVYTCPVGTEETTPPELVGKIIADEIQTEAQDRFRIGVVVFQLLFGEHPFKFPQEGNPLKIGELIQKRLWIGSEGATVNNPRLIPLDIVHPKLQDYFSKCFESVDPQLRPTANEWKKAIERAYDDLVPCQNIAALPHYTHPHFYSKHLPSCYWCDRAKKIGYDMFGQGAIQQVESSELARLVLLDKAFAQVRGKVTSASIQRNNIVLRLGKGNRTLKFGAFEIVIAPQVVSTLSDADKKALLDTKGKEMSVKGTISVLKTKAKSTPKVIVDSQPLPCHIIQS